MKELFDIMTISAAYRMSLIDEVIQKLISFNSYEKYVGFNNMSRILNEVSDPK